MLFSLLKHYLDLYISDTVLKVFWSLYCFTTSVCHGVENYFLRLWGMGISDAILMDFDFCQHVSQQMQIQGHTFDVVCTSKFLSSSAFHAVSDEISDHLAVFFTTAFPIKVSFSVKHFKIRTLSKIYKNEFISDFARSALIKAPHRTATLITKKKHLLSQHTFGLCQRTKFLKSSRQN